MLFKSYLFPLLIVDVLGMEYILLDLEKNQDLIDVHCAYALLRKYFGTSEVLSGYVLAIKLSRESADMEQDFLQFIYKDKEYPWTLLLLSNTFFENEEENKLVLDEKPMAYFSVNDISEDIREFTETWKLSPNWNPDANFIIYLSYEEENKEILIETLFDLMGRTLRTTKVLNIYAIGSSTEEDLVITATFFPYDRRNVCGSLIEQIDIVDTCQINLNSSFKVKQIKSAEYADKYPKKLSGCSLAAGYRTYDPYISRNSRNAFNGLEYKLLETVSDMLDVRINFVREENNLYGLYEMLISNEVDFIVGGLSQNPKFMVVSTTAAYYKDELTYCVAKGSPRKSYGMLMSLHPMIILLLFFVCGLSKNLFKAIKFLLKVRVIPPCNSQNIAMRLWALILAQSIKLPRMRFSGNILTLSALLVASIMNTTIQTTLISRLTSEPDVDQVKSIQDIYDGRMRITGSVEILNLLDKEGEVYKYFRKNFVVCHNMDECLIEAAESKNLVVAVSRQHVKYNPRIPRDELYCFDRSHNLYTVLITMYFPKNYYLLKRINPIILDVIEVGLMGKWENDLKAYYGFYEHSTSYQTVRVFTMQDFGGALYLAGSMLLLALLIFQLEICTYKLVKNAKFNCFIFKYLHRRVFDNSNTE